MSAPSTPAPELITRDRSDTLDSAISGSSSFLLQTPPTPAILDVLASASRAHSHAKANTITRPRLHSASTSPSPSPSPPSRVADGAEEARLARDRALSVGSSSSRMFFIDLDEADTLRDSPPPIPPSAPEGSSAGGTPSAAAPAGIAEYPFPPILGPPVQAPLTDDGSESGTRARAETAEVDGGVAKKGMKQAMRAKLERSRSSLRSLSVKLKSGEERAGEDATLQGINSGTDPSVSKRPGHARLRSLFALSSNSNSRSRSGSVASTRSAILPPVIPTPPSNYDGQPGSGPPALPAAQAQLSSDDVHGAIGPLPFIAPSSPDLVEATLVPESGALVVLPALHRPRAASEPVRLGTLSGTLAPAAQVSDTAPASKQARAVSKARRRDIDMFGTMLPREIQVMILRRVAEGCTTRSGAAGMTAFKGRKELIKLTRVSKQWRSLCLDGQLWSTINLIPLTPIMHPNTLEAILSNTRRCIRTLSLRGLDAAPPWSILHSLRPTHGGQLPGLTSLDLRGCRSFTDSDLLHLLRIVPNLRCVNMKGLQRVNRAVLKQLATARVVERVDLSRCGVDMDGLGKYLSRLDTEQMARMKVFRCAGVKGRGRAVRDVAASLGQMRNLEVLDLGGTSLDDESVHAWIDSYAAGRSIQGASGRSAEEDPVTLDRLRHLRLTGCDHLSPAALKALTGRLPCLESFELAAVPKFLRSAHTHDHTASQTRHQLARDRQAVASFFASCEGLRRVDLDDFGTRDGGVSNEMLEALEGEVIEEVHIAESGAGVDVECMVRFVRRCKHLRVFNVDSTGADDRVLTEWHKHRHGPNTCLSMLDCRDVTATRYAEVAQDSRTREGRGGYEYAPFVYCEGEVESQRAAAHASSGRRRAGGVEDEEDDDAVGEGASAILRGAAEYHEAGDGHGGAGTSSVGSNGDGGGGSVGTGLADNGARDKGLIKTAWAWKRIGVARPWREERDKARRSDLDRAGGSGGSEAGGGEDAIQCAGATRPGRGRRRRRGSWWTANGSLGAARADGLDAEVDVGGACVVM